MNDDVKSAGDSEGLESPAQKNWTGADWVIPVLGLMFTTYYLYSIKDLVWEAKIAAVFVAAVLYVLIAIFAIKSLWGVRRGSLRIDFSPLWENAELFRARAVLFGLAALSVAVLPWTGFTISTFGFLLASFLWLEKLSFKTAAITAGALALGGYVLFIVLLRTSYPQGPFEALVKSLTGI